MGVRPLAADNFDVGATPSAEARAQPIALRALAIGLVTGILVALEVLRPVHTIDVSARAAVETAIAAAAVLTSRLLIEIVARTRQLRELLLALGVLAVSLGGFSSWVGPLVAGVRGPASGDAVSLGCALIGALALAAAALAPPTSIIRPFGGLAKAAAVLGLSVIAIGTLLAGVIAVHPATGAASAAAPSLTAGVQVASAVILAVAGFAFVAGSWRAERGTELLVGACLLLAAAGVQFVAVQTVPADWVTPREGARLVAFGLLLGTAWFRHVRVQRHHAYTAVCSERERIARDLHDGLAQDLACITTQGQRLDWRLAPDDPLILATRDALAEVRGMIADLTASTAVTSEVGARPVAHERGARFDVTVDVGSEAGSVPTVESRRSQMRPAGLPRRHPLARGMSRLSREGPLRAKPRRAA
ncbi:MAG: histidine kinase dimerization/phosphoacceptor domain-containing protein [Solirubrobacteraceae bacterium]